jgi:hypothetical protein
MPNLGSESEAAVADVAAIGQALVSEIEAVLAAQSLPGPLTVSYGFLHKFPDSGNGVYITVAPAARSVSSLTRGSIQAQPSFFVAVSQILADSEPATIAPLVAIVEQLQNYYGQERPLNGIAGVQVTGEVRGDPLYEETFLRDQNLFFAVFQCAMKDSPAFTAPMVGFSFVTPGQTAGVSFQVTVIAVDSNGDAVEAYGGTIAFGSSDPQAVLPADTTLTNGEALLTFTLKTSGMQTLTAVDTGNPGLVGIKIVPTSPGPLSQFAMTLSTLTPTAGVPLDLTLSATDSFGNVVPGYLGVATFTKSAGGSVPTNYTFQLSDGGTHIFQSGVTLTTAGSETFTATDTVTPSITGSAVALVTFGPPVALVINGPSAVAFLTPFAVTVTVVDVGNNTVTSYRGTVDFSSNDLSGQAVLPSPYTYTGPHVAGGGDRGVHVFSNLALYYPSTATITVTDSITSSITGTKVITITGALMVAVTDSGFFFSPNNWYQHAPFGTAVMSAVNAGAYFKFSWVGTSCTFTLSTASLGSNALIVKTSVDGAPYTYTNISGLNSLVVANGLPNGLHTVIVYYSGRNFVTDSWTNPSQVLSITGAIISAGGVTVAPVVKPKVMLVYGESRMEGARTLSIDETGPGQDASLSCAFLLANALNAELGLVAWSGTDYANGGDVNVPPFYTPGNDGQSSWNKVYSGASRLSAGNYVVAPNFIFILGFGTNGRADVQSTYSTAVQDALAAIRGAAASAKIYVGLGSFDGYQVPGVVNGFYAYQTATPDANCQLLPCALGGFDLAGINGVDVALPAATYMSYDGVHANQYGHEVLGALLLGAYANLGNSNGLLAYDAFNGSNGTVLTSHSMIVGSGWLTGFGQGALVIESNAATGDGNHAHGDQAALTDLGVTDATLSALVKIASGDGLAGFIARWADSNNWLICIYDESNIFGYGVGLAIIENVANSIALRAFAAVTLPPTNQYLFICQLTGNVVTFKIAGNEAAWAQYAGLANLTGTKVGIYSHVNPNTFVINSSWNAFTASLN